MIKDNNSIDGSSCISLTNKLFLWIVDRGRQFNRGPEGGAASAKSVRPRRPRFHDEPMSFDMLGRIPVGRPRTPEEVAEFVCFLAQIEQGSLSARIIFFKKGEKVYPM